MSSLGIPWIQTLRHDPNGNSFIHFGDDGVVRSISSNDYTVLDARGLTPDEFKHCIRHFFRNKDPEELHKKLREIENIDGTTVSHEACFHPAAGIIPYVLNE